MLERLFSSRARVSVLKLFLFNPDDRYYQRQISALTNQPIRGVQREVEKLEKVGLLSKSKEGNRIYYKTNRACPIYEELKRILFKSAGIAEALGTNLSRSGKIRVAFIYGSYAKDRENISSDIDLMVIGDATSRELSRMLSGPKRELGREINYSVFSPDEFKKKLGKKDHFLTSIINDKKLFLVGTSNELRAVIKSR